MHIKQIFKADHLLLSFKEWWYIATSEKDR